MKCPMLLWSWQLTNSPHRCSTFYVSKIQLRCFKSTNNFFPNNHLISVTRRTDNYLWQALPALSSSHHGRSKWCFHFTHLFNVSVLSVHAVVDRIIVSPSCSVSPLWTFEATRQWRETSWWWNERPWTYTFVKGMIYPSWSGRMRSHTHTHTH